MKTTRIGLVLLVIGFLFASVALIGCPPHQPDTAGDAVMPPPGDADAGRAAGDQTIEITGSTTVLPIATAWGVAFNEANPDIDVAVSGGGSGTGIKALIDGITDIAISSREIKKSEIELAEQNDVNPVERAIAWDGIAPIVHPNNPVESLTIEQLSDIYSGEVTNWSEVGVTGMANDNIVVVSRDSASGTYESWKEMVIQMGGEAADRDYAPAALKKGSNKDVGQTVAQTESAIGYIGLGYIDDTIKTVAVGSGGEAVEPTHENVQDGSYPVARKLYMYTNGEPTGTIADFLEWGMTEAGQSLVEEEGFVAVE